MKHRARQTRARRRRGNKAPAGMRVPDGAVHLKQWGMGKAPLARWLVQSIAAGADMLLDVIRINGRQVTLSIAQQRPREWRALYWNHVRSMKLLTAQLRTQFMPQLSEFEALSVESIKSWQQFAEIQQKTIAFGDEFVRQQIDDPARVGDVDELDEARMLEHMEGAYYLFVLVPCVIRFDTVPSVLLWRARRGDFDALCKLLVLDVAMLDDPRIRRQFYHFRSKGTPGERRKLMNAINGMGYRMPSAKAIKAQLIAFADEALRGLDDGLQKMAERFPQLDFPAVTQTAPQYREAFNAFARDRKGQLEDLDLPTSDETWYKLIQRAKGRVPDEFTSRTNRESEMSG